MIVARETAWLSREHRAAVDRELAPRLEALGDKRVETEAKKAAHRIDPSGFVDRLSNAAHERWVGLRPAPDAMARLTALLPVAQGVAVYAALGRNADTSIATGDARGRGQVMADTLVERVTGQDHAEQVPVEVNLVIDTDTLLGNGTEPALIGGVPIPATTARELALQHTAPRWLRRLYTQPSSGELVAMDTKRRLFTKGQRRACNYAKQAPGWKARPGPAGRIDLITPTGHRYRSSPPRLTGTEKPESPVEQRLRELLHAAHQRAAA